MKYVTPSRYPWSGAEGTCDNCETHIYISADEDPQKLWGRIVTARYTSWRVTCPTCQEVAVVSKLIPDPRDAEE